MYVYTDTSALFKLLVLEPGTDQARRVWEEADQLATSTLIGVEAAAALTKAVREGRLDQETAVDLFGEGFVTLVAQMDLISPGLAVLNQATDCVSRTPLRAYDAVHLASALVAGVDVMLTADKALFDAAQEYGLDSADCRGQT